MANKKQIIMFVFLLLGLFSFVQSIEIDPNIVNWISYYKDQEITTEVISNSTAKEIKYAVEFLTTKEGGEEYPGPFYLKIEISVESNTPSPLLCFSHDDSYCEIHIVKLEIYLGKILIIKMYIFGLKRNNMKMNLLSLISQLNAQEMSLIVLIQ